MDVGISLASSTALTATDAGRHLVARGRAAHRAGLASLSVGDSHARPHGYLQNTPSLGRLLAEWPDRPAGCLFLLPMWQPVLVAEQVATLAALHDAPFIVQTGIGGSPAQLAALGAPSGHRVTRFEEAVRVVRSLLAGEVVSSELFGFDDVAIGPTPVHPIDWWMGTMAEPGVRRAARSGAAWYAAPGATPNDFGPLDDAYRAACAEAGTSARVMLRRDALVLPDADLARRAASEAVDGGYRGMRLEELVVGGVDDAVEQLAPWAARGVDQIVVRTMGLDPGLDLETIEAIGEVRRRLVGAASADR